MEDVYREYRTKISHGDEYKSHVESKPSYGNNQKTHKTEYSPERHLPARSEGERIEQQTSKPAKIEPKIEMQDNDELTGPCQLPIVELGEKRFFLDERFQELRDTKDFSNSISFKDLDLIPEKKETPDQYEIKQQADVKDVFNLPKYEEAVEFGQTNINSRKRPSLYGDRLE